MNKLNYLIETKEKYQVYDDTGSFTISVIESADGIHFDIKVQGVLASTSLSKCADLLKELIKVDCYNAVVQPGEKPGNIKVTKKVTTRLDGLLQQRNSFVSKK